MPAPNDTRVPSTAGRHLARPFWSARYLSPLFLILYGCAMGSRPLLTGDGSALDQWTQVLYSGLKVPILLGLTFLLSLPSLFVFCSLAGLARDFRRIVRILLITQEAFSGILIGLAPLTVFWYVSTTGYVGAVLFNACVFGLAALGRQRVLRRHHAVLIARNRRHRMLLRVWLLTYVFVGIQAGWMLRPFIGTPGAEPQIFRRDGWGNAYVEVWNMLVGCVPF